jgi:hypothetical protein
MRRARQEFDRQLFTRKLSKPDRQMQIESFASDKAAGSALIRVVDGQLAVLRNWLETRDRIAREVWQRQGEIITPEFVREILVPEAMTLIGAREGTIKSLVTPPAPRTRLEDPHPAQHHLAMEIRKLQAEVNNQYEIEAREIEYQKAPEQSAPSKQNAATEQRGKRLRATVSSLIAARKMEKYLESKAIGQTEFAITVGTTDRTLRSFRKTGKVRRDILESIAKQMRTTKEALLKE